MMVAMVTVEMVTLDIGLFLIFLYHLVHWRIQNWGGSESVQTSDFGGGERKLMDGVVLVLLQEHTNTESQNLSC